jgi:hypothetical protein
VYLAGIRNVGLETTSLDQQPQERHTMETGTAQVTETKPLIDSSRVREIFLECMYGREELKDGKPIEGESIKAEGIVCTVGFHPGRLESHREEVKGMLEGLPLQFRSNEGQGWTFLNACNDRNGVQWTNMHQRMEQLFQLGIGLGLAKCLMPRELWAVLPGGMPYYSVL